MSAEVRPLRGAADIIQANGLARGEYIDLLAGDPPLPPAKCPVCPRSAIALAVGRDPLFVVEWPLHCDGSTGSEVEEADRALIVSAERTLRRYLVAELAVDAAEDDDDGGVIERWADGPAITQPQVVGGDERADETAHTTPTGDNA